MKDVRDYTDTPTMTPKAYVQYKQYIQYSTVQYSTSFLLARHQLWLGGVLVSLGVGAGVRPHRVTELIEQSVRSRAPA